MITLRNDAENKERAEDILKSIKGILLDKDSDYAMDYVD